MVQTGIRSEPFLHYLFRPFPEFLHLLVLRVFLGKRLGVSAHVEGARPLSGILVQQQADGGVGPLAWRAYEGAEEEVGQRVEPHVHGDDVRRHDARVSGIDHDAAVFDAGGQVEGEECQRQLGVAVDGDAPEATFAASGEEVGKVQVSYGVGARYHVDHAASLSHQWQELACQQVGACIVDADRALQSVLGDVPGGFHGAGAVHQECEWRAFGQERVGKFGYGRQRGQVQPAHFDLQVGAVVQQGAADGFGFLFAAGRHDDVVARLGHGAGDFGTHSAIGTGDDGQPSGLWFVMLHGWLGVFLFVRFLSSGRKEALPSGVGGRPFRWSTCGRCSSCCAGSCTVLPLRPSCG